MSDSAKGEDHNEHFIEYYLYIDLENEEFLTDFVNLS